MRDTISFSLGVSLKHLSYSAGETYDYESKKVILAFDIFYFPSPPLFFIFSFFFLMVWKTFKWIYGFTYVYM